MTRRNHRNEGGKMLYVGDLAALTQRHLPETCPPPRRYGIRPIPTPPRETLWRAVRVRPEVATVLDGLARRHEDVTGKKITHSEVIAAAFNLSLPVLASRVFPPANVGTTAR